MEIILNRYLNKDTGVYAFKRLVVKEDSGFFRVYQETDRGYGQVVVSAMVPSIKPYKTRKGAERAMQSWRPATYKMTLVEGLMAEGKI